MSTESKAAALLVLPHLRIQNANAISSPMTWGFPAMSAFLGWMTALERRLGRDAGIEFWGLGVICHRCDVQTDGGRYQRRFSLTRNPLQSDGSTAAIVEEGRVHLDLTVVIDAGLSAHNIDEAERAALAARIGAAVSQMRLAGGSILPQSRDTPAPRQRAQLLRLPEEADAQRRAFRRLTRDWLPGFTLVERSDLLQSRLAELRAQQPGSTALDAWLDLCRWNHHAVREEIADPDGGTHSVRWQTEKRPGWIVPIPVGYAGLEPLHAPGRVANARDRRVPLHFVESVYSIGQWLSPHRLHDAQQMFWRYDRYDETQQLYRVYNEYASSSTPAAAPTSPAAY